MATVDFEKVALLLGSLAFQLFIGSFALSDYRLLPSTSDDDGVQALLILAFIFFLTSFVLLLLQNFSELKSNKIAQLVTLILVAIAALFDIIGIALYGSTIKQLSHAVSFSLTVYSTAAIFGLATAVCIVLTICKR